MARPFKEIGVASENRPDWGLRSDEFVVQLRGRQGVRKFREMKENDPIIGAILHAMEMMLRSIEWRTEGGTAEGRDFLQSVMHSMDDKSWEEFIADVLTFLPYGFSLFEIVPRRDDDGLVRIKKLAGRAQYTIDRFETRDNGDVLGAWQIASQRNVFIPYSRLLHFRTTSVSGEPAGRSVLRSAYTAWKAQNNIKYFEGVGIERELNGMPVAYIPSEYMASDASDGQKAIYNQIKKILRDVKRNEQGYVVFPSDLYQNEDGSMTSSRMVDFQLVASKGTRDIKTGEVIVRYQQEIARSVMADFVMLGANDRGSFALSQSKSELFLKALEGYADTIAAHLNRKLVPMLWELNGMGKESMPTINRGRVAPVDIDELGQYVQRLALSGVQLFPDETLENHMRSVAGLPAVDPNRQLPPEPEADDAETG